MTDYKNLGGASNVARYQIGRDFIIVEFKPRSKSGYNTYKYSYMSTGQAAVEEMKKLALNGEGLNAYIAKYIRKNFENKW